MGAVATFSFPTFAARYPEFAGLSPALAAQYFAEAAIYHANDGSGPVQDTGQQLTLLNMLTAHIAKLNALNPDGSSAAGLVGPITSATEGSVSVSSGLVVEAGTRGWFQQTPYGAAYLAATAGYRTMHYVSGRRPLNYGFGYGGQRLW